MMKHFSYPFPFLPFLLLPSSNFVSSCFVCQRRRQAPEGQSECLCALGADSPLASNTTEGQLFQPHQDLSFPGSASEFSVICSSYWACALLGLCVCQLGKLRDLSPGGPLAWGSCSEHGCGLWASWRIGHQAEKGTTSIEDLHSPPMWASPLSSSSSRSVPKAVSWGFDQVRRGGLSSPPYM